MYWTGLVDGGEAAISGRDSSSQFGLSGCFCYRNGLEQKEGGKAKRRKERALKRCGGRKSFSKADARSSSM